ncbi:DUF4856 domain-containing protein [Winogradskyella aurantiaca]|uniref:DUF4856 domain-containing protein n=1 Tax=Winogradskyella aurantiaca TaxID=2219558 RepID=UPI000E1DEF3D|nr:DUF4856 domain-containing protein [Winogradskyella aurantiaca]
MKKIIAISLISCSLAVSCSDDDISGGGEELQAPATYSFTREGNTTVSYSGQTTRIQMGNQFGSALKDTSKSADQLLSMYAHEEGESNFSNATLNGSDKNIRSKTAASRDYYSANTTISNQIKADFEFWINAQVAEVFPAWNTNASAGVPGQLQEGGGGSIRYVSAKGLEYDQAIVKGLIGALMTDQMLNNYLSTSVLDEGDNVSNNNSGIVVEGKNYTTMEHKWDEAFGYLYGNEADAMDPELNVDSFLNKYLSRVDNDADFTGIADEIYDAFKLGRAAIVAGDYNVRDPQADIIREAVSEIIAIRSVYYLQQGKQFLSGDKGAAFHDLSEGFGFIYSLQFTRRPGTNTPYFTKSEVDGFLATLLEGNGFWDITEDELDTMSEIIASRFDFTVAEAAN